MKYTDRDLRIGASEIVELQKPIKEAAFATLELRLASHCVVRQDDDRDSEASIHPARFAYV